MEPCHGAGRAQLFTFQHYVHHDGRDYRARRDVGPTTLKFSKRLESTEGCLPERLPSQPEQGELHRTFTAPKAGEGR